MAIGAAYRHISPRRVVAIRPTTAVAARAGMIALDADDGRGGRRWAYDADRRFLRLFARIAEFGLLIDRYYLARLRRDITTTLSNAQAAS